MFKLITPAGYFIWIAAAHVRKIDLVLVLEHPHTQIHLADYSIIQIEGDRRTHLATVVNTLLNTPTFTVDCRDVQALHA